ncbi:MULTISPECIES: ArsA family ATPase [unclassified Streptomyces]|uniref:ArsA family ATPase n=1 Tax=unclassified Streptomyces TaxID=2593676 RepID=UPI00202511B6|nr:MULTISPECIES: ArsA-related P-loop ATPase [unclassified Streptomyces]WSC22976.1 ArsA family ATPase [Streptomyces sp. NBC_01766]
MRTVLVTGLGGAGRTTVAAVTALRAARAGERVLLLSTDRDPGEALPAARDAGVRAERIDSAAHFRTELRALQERSAAALEMLGAARLDEEDLTELPGAEQFGLLHALRTHDSAEWDLVVVDMPPVQETLAVLALPQQLRRALRRLLPPERQAARALRPMLAQLAGVPMPAQWLYETTARWESELAAVQARIEDPATTLRLVAEPSPATTRALRTARTGIALHGRSLDMVVANRLLPTGSRDPWLASLAAQQQEHLKELYADFGAVQELPHLGRSPRTADDLTALERPEAPLVKAPGRYVEDRLAGDGVLVWHLPLPGAVKEELGLVRHGDELLLTAGPFRTTVDLPSALRRCTVAGAALADEVLSIRFTPDPRLWPQGR